MGRMGVGEGRILETNTKNPTGHNKTVFCPSSESGRLTPQVTLPASYTGGGGGGAWLVDGKASKQSMHLILPAHLPPPCPQPSSASPSPGRESSSRLKGVHSECPTCPFLRAHPSITTGGDRPRPQHSPPPPPPPQETR